jgi:NADH-quinone oxidoreductase subunit E
MQKRIASGSAHVKGAGTRKGKVGLRESGRGREAPLDPAVAHWLETAKTQSPPARPAAIPMLQSAQSALGYLPGDALKAIARHLGVSPAVVEGVASFYAQFRFTAPGRHRVTVCSGTACYVRGSGKLMDDLKADLHIAPGETSPDGAITLESVSCFGACALAPVVVVDDKVLRQQTSASVKQVVAGLAAETPAPGTGRAAGKAAPRSRRSGRSAAARARP